MCYKHITGQVYNQKTLVLGCFQSAWSKGETVVNQWQGHGWHTLADARAKRGSSLDHSQPTDAKEVNAGCDIKVSESTGCCLLLPVLTPLTTAESTNRHVRLKTGPQGNGRRWASFDDGGSLDFWWKKGDENNVRWVLIMLGLIGVCGMYIPVLKKIFLTKILPFFYSYIYLHNMHITYLLRKCTIDLVWLEEGT